MKVIRLLILACLLMATIWLPSILKSNYSKMSNLGLIKFPEIEELRKRNFNFDDLKIYFTHVSNKKGAKYAFEVLRVSQLPPNTDMHLLGHVIGDVLYKQQGAEGIQSCTQEFRNACSHSIVVGLFTDKGEGALDEIQEACKKAPGGLGAYTMCYHGLGHGILAYTGYDFPKTIQLCRKTGALEHNNSEYPECVSGAVMEIISGGGHDPQLWRKLRLQYLKPDDPFYICSPAFMPDEARGRCYDYITPYLWEAIGANINNPTEEHFAKSFKLCNAIHEENFRRICFGGFGKEFVALAQSKDIRKVETMNDDALKKVVDWCQLADEKYAVNACLISALSSIFWGGENDYHASIRFCNAVSDSTSQSACFTNLIGQSSYFIKDHKIKESFCKELPNQFLQVCKSRMKK